MKGGHVFLLLGVGALGVYLYAKHKAIAPAAAAGATTVSPTNLVTPAASTQTLGQQLGQLANAGIAQANAAATGQ